MRHAIGSASFSSERQGDRRYKRTSTKVTHNTFSLKTFLVSTITPLNQNSLPLDSHTINFRSLQSINWKPCKTISIARFEILTITQLQTLHENINQFQTYTIIQLQTLHENCFQISTHTYVNMERKLRGKCLKTVV